MFRWHVHPLSSRKLKADNDDQRFGIEIVRKAVQTPLRQIAENAGEDGAVFSGKVLDKNKYNWLFDAQLLYNATLHSNADKSEITLAFAAGHQQKGPIGPARLLTTCRRRRL